jgi:hypothetical protein
MEMLSFDIYRVQNLDGSETAHFVAQPKLNKENTNQGESAFILSLRETPANMLLGPIWCPVFPSNASLAPCCNT